MPNFQMPVYSETEHTGGENFIGADSITVSGPNAMVFTRNAAGNYSLNRTAAGAETYTAVFSIRIPRRLAEKVNYQEQFGGSGPGPKGVVGAPPFTGATQLVPPTTSQLKGVKLIDITVIYSVAVVNLTSASLSMNRTAFANAVAPAVTNIPLSGPAMSLVAQADLTTPYRVTNTVTTPAYVGTDFTDINGEFQWVMANTGQIAFYGFFFHNNFNWN